MVKIMENPIKMDDLGGFPIIFGNTHMIYIRCSDVSCDWSMSKYDPDMRDLRISNPEFVM